MKKFVFAVVSERRWRETMEDNHCVVSNFAGNEDWLFGGVFDGHGHRRVADGLAENMAEFVKQEMLLGKDAKTAMRLAYKKAAESSWALKENEGSCAAIFLIQDRTVFCANAGDCRIIALGKSARQLTRDHNTENRLEARRIRMHGGIINNGYVERGMCLIAVTRAIGDMFFWQVGLIPTPFSSKSILREADRFLVAASDGLFGKVSNKRVFDISRGLKTAEEFAGALKQEVERGYNRDNLTIIVVQLK